MTIKWQFNWKLTVLVLLLLPVLLLLGFWQLDRAEFKRSIKAEFVDRAAMPPVELDELKQRALSSEDEVKQLAFRKVRLDGRYLNAYTALLDNQIEQGRPGYHVITLFESTQGVQFWINRGWVVATPTRETPAIDDVFGNVSLEASIYLPQGKAVMLADDNWSQQWPLLIQSADIPKLNQHYVALSHAALRNAPMHEAALNEENLFPALLRLEPGYQGSFSIDWPVVNTQPQKHTGYAVQWFAMAFALVACWLYASLRSE